MNNFNVKYYKHLQCNHIEINSKEKHILLFMNHHLHHQFEREEKKYNEKREVKGKEKNSNEIVKLKLYAALLMLCERKEHKQKFEKEKKFL